MAITWNKIIPRWGGDTIEPPEAKKDTGYITGDKPPAKWENWLRKGTYEALDETRDVIENIDSQLAQMENNDKAARDAINDLKIELEEKGLVDFIDNNTGVGYYDTFNENSGIDLAQTTAVVNNVAKNVTFTPNQILKFKAQAFENITKVEAVIHINKIDEVQVTGIIANDTIEVLLVPNSRQIGDKLYYNGVEYIITELSIL